MSDDLVKRLRDCEFMGMPLRLDYSTAHEAADRIEELEVAIKRQASASKKLRSFDLERTQQLEAIDRSEYTAAKTLDSERQANEMLTDRIEELEAKVRSSALQELSTLGQASEAYQAQLAAEAKLADCEKYRDAYAECDRIGTQAVRDLEAKLAKAVEALDLMIFHAHGLEKQLTEDLFNQDFCGESVTLTVSRTTLAALKGQDDEVYTPTQ